MRRRGGELLASLFVFGSMGVQRVTEQPPIDKPKTVFCESCGNATQAKQVYVSMPTDTGLVLIENVPARVCSHCQEQYYDEATAQKITKLASNGFPKRHAVREITVPVFSLDEVQLGTIGKNVQEK